MRLSRIGATTVLVIDATIIVGQAGGPRRTERYLLITTLADEKRYPAGELVTPYHRRWEIETSYLELSPAAGRLPRPRRASHRPNPAMPDSPRFRPQQQPPLSSSR
jgi:hypothetical protein